MDLGTSIGVAGWFIQVSFDKYITHVLEKWTSDVGLNEEYKLLTNKLEYIKIVLASAEGGKKIQNNELAKYVQKVQYVVYQAEDLLDEMQYYRNEHYIMEGRSGDASSSASQDSLSTLETLQFSGREVVDLTGAGKNTSTPYSLNELQFWYCSNLNSLPNQLCNLSSLKTLAIHGCRGIKSLPENGLPTSLETLAVIYCTDELKRECNNITRIKYVKVY